MTQLSLVRTLFAAIVGTGPAILFVRADCSADELTNAGAQCTNAGDGETDSCKVKQKILDCHVATGCCEKGFLALKEADATLTQTCPDLTCDNCPAEELAVINTQCTNAGAGEMDACEATQKILDCHFASGCCPAGFAALKGLDPTLTETCPQLKCVDDTCKAAELTSIGALCSTAGAGETDTCKATQKILDCHVESGCCSAGFAALKAGDPKLTQTCPSLKCDVATCPPDELTAVGAQCANAADGESDNCKAKQKILDCHVPSSCCEAGFAALKEADDSLTTTCPQLACATPSTTPPASGGNPDSSDNASNSDNNTGGNNTEDNNTGLTDSAGRPTDLCAVAAVVVVLSAAPLLSK